MNDQIRDPLNEISNTYAAIMQQLLSTYLPADISALDMQTLKLGLRLSLTHLVKRVTFDGGVTGRGDSLKQMELISQLRDELNTAREELKLTNTLLDARNAVLSLIPECEDHGAQCLPNAQKWIENALGSGDIELTESDVGISVFKGGISVYHNESGLRIDIKSGRSVHAKKAAALRMVRHYLKTENYQ